MEISNLVNNTADFVVDGLMVLGSIFVVLVLLAVGLSAINEVNNLDKEKEHVFSIKISKIIKHIESDKNQENEIVLNLMINRFDQILIAFNKLFNVENKSIRKKNTEYLEVACYHEYESVNKVIDLIDKGIPSTHKNVLELLEAIIEGLETKYNEFIVLSTEEVVEETKVLKLLHQKEINDSEFINEINK